MKGKQAMASFSHYYSRAKGGLVRINPEEAFEHFVENFAIVAGTGAMLGLLSASLGGMDKQVAGFSVPVDGIASVSLGLAGLALGMPELKTASIAAGGSAATRAFEKFFKKSIAHGELDSVQEQFGYGYGYGGALPAPSDAGAVQSQFGFAWGAERSDPILAAGHAL